MLKKRIIPCLDITEGRVVKDPVAYTKRINDLLVTASETGAGSKEEKSG